MGQQIGIFALGDYGELGQDYLSRARQKYVAIRSCAPLRKEKNVS